MKLTRKITLQHEDGSFDGIEIETDFPELLGIPEQSSILAKLDALRDAIMQAHGRAPAAAQTPAPTSTPPASTPPASTPPASSDLHVLLAEVGQAKTQKELLAVNAKLAAVPAETAKAVRDAARLRYPGLPAQ